MARNVDGSSCMNLNTIIPELQAWQIETPHIDGFWGGNCSIAQGPEGYALMVTYRDLHRDDNNYCSYGADNIIRTRNFFTPLDDQTLTPQDWHEIPSVETDILYPHVLGVEDPRLYWNEEWMYSGTIRQHHVSGEPRTAICSLASGLIEIQPAEDGTWVKNLMPTGVGNEFIDAKTLLGPHGGAVTRYGNGYIGIVHELEHHQIYHHKFAEFANDGTPLGASKSFELNGDLKIEFAAGIVTHGSDFVVSFGVMDRQVWLMRLPIAKVVGILERLSV